MRSHQLYALLMLQLHPKQATGPGSFYCFADNFPWYRCIILRYIDGTRRARIGLMGKPNRFFGEESQV
jgi:hypothetical protein